MSEQTREHLDTFWELIDEILNAVLFVLIGLEVLVLELSNSAVAPSSPSRRYPGLLRGRPGCCSRCRCSKGCSRRGVSRC